jgi:pyruvate/2-oxoglutarate dehydrogenase complex dihydrolipoamide acyltransferase (E2) component
MGINVKPLAIKKNRFGAACLTSVGMIGFKDATAPFTGYFMINLGFTGCTFFVALNAVQEVPLIEDGKIVIGKIVNLNFAVDHRYVDGGRCKKLFPAFEDVFENPEKYLRGNKHGEAKKSK